MPPAGKTSVICCSMKQTLLGSFCLHVQVQEGCCSRVTGVHSLLGTLVWGVLGAGVKRVTVPVFQAQVGGSGAFHVADWASPQGSLLPGSQADGQRPKPPLLPPHLGKLHRTPFGPLAAKQMPCACRGCPASLE